MASSSDAVVIGGGIIGTSAAALLAEAGLAVVLVEKRALAAGASGRNSGSVQHPFDPVLGELHAGSVAMYRQLAAEDEAFGFPSHPAGLVLVANDEAALSGRLATLARRIPELRPRLLDPDELRRTEPAVADGVWGIALDTGYGVVPAAATLAFARRAQRAEARMLLGSAAEPVVREGRVVGARLHSGEVIRCHQLLVAAGPQTAPLVPGWSAAPPIAASWGVVASTRLPNPPRAILEEIGIDRTGSAEPVTFSLVTAGGDSSVGSTFLAERPVPEPMAERLMRRGASFIPALSSAPIEGVRVCARPLSVDGRPFVGAIGDVEGLFVCAGHGPWGISIGPATSRAVTDVMLGRGEQQTVAAELSPRRLAEPGAPRELARCTPRIDP